MAVPPGETAIARTLRYPEIGAGSSKQVDGIIGAMDFWLTPRKSRGTGSIKRNDFGELILYSFHASEIPARSIEKTQHP
jgi:hypothetical protein